MKDFPILATEYPVSMLKIFDDVFIVCAAISHSVHPPPFLLGGGVEPPTNISKRGGA